MGSSNAWANVLDRVRYEPARKAALILIEGLGKAGLNPSEKGGVTSSVRFHDEYGRYILSFICNRADLLLYVRKPAIRAMSTLPIQAAERFRDVTTNTANECKIRIQSVPEAEDLLGWLAPLLPLPFPLKHQAQC